MDDLVSQPREVKKRRRYSREFKDQILAECADPSVSTAEVARRHGINDNMIYNWRAARKSVDDDSFVKLPSAPLPVTSINSAGSERGANTVRFELPSSKGTVIVCWPLEELEKSIPWLKALMQ
jgi:transposase